MIALGIGEFTLQNLRISARMALLQYEGALKKGAPRREGGTKSRE